MNDAIQISVYRGLSDSLEAAGDTGNADELKLVLKDAVDAYHESQITLQQLADLVADAQQYLD